MENEHVQEIKTKNGIVIHYVVFQFIRMAFGLTNALGCFQRTQV